MTSQAKMEGDPSSFVSNPLVFVDDAHQFNKNLLQGRAKHFKQSIKVNAAVSFFDRGVPDVLAYMDFFGQSYGEDFIAYCEIHRYDQIFIVPPWKEIYKTDEERLETFEEAENIHKALWNTYSRFGYRPVLVPKDSVSQRIDFILQTLDPT